MPDFVLKPKRRMPDYYVMLGVLPSSNYRTIRDSYYGLAAMWHPDRVKDNAHIRDINEAWCVLKDVKLRKAYDAKRKLLNKPCLTCNGEGVLYRSKSFTKREAITCTACCGSGLQGGVNARP